MPQPSPAASRGGRRVRATPVRPAIVDQLETPRDALDRLIHDMRLGTPSQRVHDDFEERAQQIAAAIVTPFRGAAAPVAQPLHVERNGSRASAWF
jgi:hypothetical protein